MTQEPLRVLLIEDSEPDATLIVRELRRIGRPIEHLRVQDGAAMRAALADRTWDVVISDWTMPRFSAIHALEVLHEAGRDLPFVIVSGTVGEDVAVDAMRRGAHDYVLKDKLARLVPAIERELRECAARRRDAIERQRMVEQLRASERRYRRIIETTNEGVWMIDADGKTTFMNDRMATLLGRALEDLTGTLLFDYIDPATHGVGARSLATYRGGVGSQAATTFLKKDGTKLYTIADSTPIFSDSGLFEGVLFMVMDQTSPRLAEEALRASEARFAQDQLRQAQKLEAVGRLAGGVAHDFNNILSVILSYVDLIGETVSDSVRADLDEIRRAGERAAVLTKQLLMFSRHQTNRPTVFDLDELVAGMITLLRRLVGEDIDVVVRRGGALKQLRADAGLIEQVIVNLVVNARDAMPAGGKLTIATELLELDDTFVRGHLGAMVGPHIRLAISDSGPMLDAAIQARIFEPFYTAHEAGQSSGLGLSTVFGVVRQANGTIWVRSDTAGTTFEVYLPAVVAAADSIVAAVPEPITGGLETILVVEDEDQVRHVACGILRRNGYQVIEARDGSEALSLAEEHPGPIHLLLSDVVMPQMSGPELGRRLVDHRPAMKVLCMSGYADNNIVRREVDDIPFLQKPLTPELLARKVRDVLDARR